MAEGMCPLGLYMVCNAFYVSFVPRPLGDGSAGAPPAEHPHSTSWWEGRGPFFSCQLTSTLPQLHPWWEDLFFLLVRSAQHPHSTPWWDARTVFFLGLSAPPVKTSFPGTCLYPHKNKIKVVIIWQTCLLFYSYHGNGGDKNIIHDIKLFSNKILGNVNKFGGKRKNPSRNGKQIYGRGHNHRVDIILRRNLNLHWSYLNFEIINFPWTEEGKFVGLHRTNPFLKHGLSPEIFHFRMNEPYFILGLTNLISFSD